MKKYNLRSMNEQEREAYWNSLRLLMQSDKNNAENIEYNGPTLNDIEKVIPNHRVEVNN